MTGVVVEPMASEQIEAVADVLTRAFLPDPIWVALWPEENRRRRHLARMFNSVVRTTQAAGGYPIVTRDVAAAAVWIPPGRAVGVRAYARTGFALPRAVLTLRPAEIVSMLRMVTWMEARRAALVPQPHWYLEVIGVDPTCHGQGLGTRLVREGLRRADDDGTPAYLETETEGNVRFYEGLGFTVLEHDHAPGVGVPIWLMARAPG